MFCNCVLSEVTAKARKFSSVSSLVLSKDTASQVITIMVQEVSYLKIGFISKENKKEIKKKIINWPIFFSLFLFSLLNSTNDDGVS